MWLIEADLGLEETWSSAVELRTVVFLHIFPARQQLSNPNCAASGARLRLVESICLRATKPLQVYTTTKQLVYWIWRGGQKVC